MLVERLIVALSRIVALCEPEHYSFPFPEGPTAGRTYEGRPAPSADEFWHHLMASALTVRQAVQGLPSEVKELVMWPLQAAHLRSRGAAREGPDLERAASQDRPGTERWVVPLTPRVFWKHTAEGDLATYDAALFQEWVSKEGSRVEVVTAEVLQALFLRWTRGTPLPMHLAAFEVPAPHAEWLMMLQILPDAACG